MPNQVSFIRILKKSIDLRQKKEEINSKKKNTEFSIYEISVAELETVIVAKSFDIRSYVITNTMKDTRALPHIDIINRTTT